MKNIGKFGGKLLAVLIAVMMVFQMVPASVYAEISVAGDPNVSEEEIQEGIVLSEIPDETDESEADAEEPDWYRNADDGIEFAVGELSSSDESAFRALLDDEYGAYEDGTKKYVIVKGFTVDLAQGSSAPEYPYTGVIEDLELLEGTTLYTLESGVLVPVDFTSGKDEDGKKFSSILLNELPSEFVLVAPVSPDDLTPRFGATLRQGATENENGDWVWDASYSDPGHSFIYRVTFALSGEGSRAAGSVEIKVPASILRDRDGGLCDVLDPSVPEWNDPDLTDDVLWVYRMETDEDGNEWIVVFNRLEMPAAQEGWVEFGYVMREKSYEYADYDPDGVGTDNNPNPCNASDVFTAELLIYGEPRAEKEAPPVCIDTHAVVTSQTKYRPTYYSSWQSSWGSKPADADQYTYLVWEIRTVIDNTTSPYDFTLKDLGLTDENGNAIEHTVYGYRLQGQTIFTLASDPDEGVTVYNLKQNYRYGRYDYVLTRLPKSEYPETSSYTVINKAMATVDPIDQVDQDTYAYSRKPYYFEGIGNYGGSPGSWAAGKIGLDYKGHQVYNSEDIRIFTLDRFYNMDAAGEPVDPDGTLDNLAYGVHTAGHPGRWTLDPNAGSNPTIDDYWVTPVTYIIEDETLQLRHFMSGTTFGPALTKEDYQLVWDPSSVP